MTKPYYTAGLNCPKDGCKGKCKTADSRGYKKASEVRRIRECRVCGYRFATIEGMTVRGDLYVVKRDGTSEPFDRIKLTQSIRVACAKRHITEERFKLMVDRICNLLDIWDVVYEQRARKGHYIRVSYAKIAQLVMDSLKELDVISWIRYVSVFKRFHHPDDFGDLIDTI
jgi:transcriptional repressor NrdR